MIRIVALLALALATSGEAAAQATVPTLDVEKGCKAAAQAGDGQPTTVKICMDEENEARAELVKRWASFTDIDRKQCIAEVSGFAPSYVELIECIKDAAEAREMEKKGTLPK